MNREISYKDCINFIENKLHVKLFAFQKEIIRCFCEDKEVRTSRVIGRSTCADVFGKYIAHLYDKNDYSTEPDVFISYQEAVAVGLLKEELVKKMGEYMTDEQFELEFCSKKINS